VRINRRKNSWKKFKYGGHKDYRYRPADADLFGQRVDEYQNSSLGLSIRNCTLKSKSGHPSKHKTLTDVAYIGIVMEEHDEREAQMQDVECREVAPVRADEVFHRL